MASRSAPVSQCQKPRGWLGRFVLRRMNSSHSKLTDWGLAQIAIEKNYTILDVGCGGGRTVSKLAAMATQGKAYGVDYSEESVAATKKTNERAIEGPAWLGVSVAVFGRHVRSRHCRGDPLLVAELGGGHSRSLPSREARRRARRHCGGL